MAALLDRQCTKRLNYKQKAHYYFGAHVSL